MLKNKFKIITLLTVIILSFTVPIVRAENEDNSSETSENDIAPISSNDETNPVVDSTPSEDSLKKEDVYLVGDNVTIDYIVDGNLFVFANTVTINSQIGGDAFICANKVIVEDQGYIFSNLFTVSQDVEIKGVVYDVYAVSNNLSVQEGYIYRDLRVSCNNLTITGTVGRNAFVNCSNIAFSTNDTNTESDEESSNRSTTGVINGNLNYSSKNEISIPEGAVYGEANFNKVIANNDSTIKDYILSIGTFIATVLIIWLACLWIAPKFLDNTRNLVSKKTLPVIGIGLLTPIVTVIISIILFMIGITAPIGFITLGILFILLAISKSIFTISINNLICNRFKIEKTAGILGTLIASSAVLYLIGLIPYVGSIVNFIAIVIGLGIIIYSVPVKFKKEKKEKNEKNEKE